jgi:hypothetical protein
MYGSLKAMRKSRISVRLGELPMVRREVDEPRAQNFIAIVGDKKAAETECNALDRGRP